MKRSSAQFGRTFSRRLAMQAIPSLRERLISSFVKRAIRDGFSKLVWPEPSTEVQRICEAMGIAFVTESRFKASQREQSDTQRKKVEYTTELEMVSIQMALNP